MHETILVVHICLQAFHITAAPESAVFVYPTLILKPDFEVHFTCKTEPVTVVFALQYARFTNAFEHVVKAYVSVLNGEKLETVSVRRGAKDVSEAEADEQNTDDISESMAMSQLLHNPLWSEAQSDLSIVFKAVLMRYTYQHTWTARQASRFFCNALLFFKELQCAGSKVLLPTENSMDVAMVYEQLQHFVGEAVCRQLVNAR